MSGYTFFLVFRAPGGRPQRAQRHRQACGQDARTQHSPAGKRAQPSNRSGVSQATTFPEQCFPSPQGSWDPLSHMAPLGPKEPVQPMGPSTATCKTVGPHGPIQSPWTPMGSHRSSPGWHGAQWGPEDVMSFHRSHRYNGAWPKNRQQVRRRTPKLTLVTTNRASRAPAIGPSPPYCFRHLPRDGELSLPPWCEAHNGDCRLPSVPTAQMSKCHLRL